MISMVDFPCVVCISWNIDWYKIGHQICHNKGASIEVMLLPWPKKTLGCFCFGPRKHHIFPPSNLPPQKGGFVGQRWYLHRRFSTVDSTCFPTTRWVGGLRLVVAGGGVMVIGDTLSPQPYSPRHGSKLDLKNKTCRAFGCFVREFVIRWREFWMSLWKKSWGILIVRVDIQLSIWTSTTYQHLNHLCIWLLQVGHFCMASVGQSTPPLPNLKGPPGIICLYFNSQYS